MGIAYRCDARLRCTFVVAHGDVSPEDWEAHFTRIAVDPAFPPGPLVLADLRTAIATVHTPHELVRDLAHRWNAYVSDFTMQWALLPNGAWQLGAEFEDELELERSNIRIILFNEISGACTWLGVSVEDAQVIVDELRREAGSEPIID